MSLGKNAELRINPVVTTHGRPTDASLALGSILHHRLPLDAPSRVLRSSGVVGLTLLRVKFAF
jgi:hypothetical protein